MATKRALSHLNAIVEAQAITQNRFANLITRMQQYNASVDAVLQDADRAVAETITEATTGLEALSLAQIPVKAGSVTLYLDNVEVAPSTYKVSYVTGQITYASVPIGKTLRAEYAVEGLTSQVSNLLSTMPGLVAQDFLDIKANYETAITWIRQNFAV